MEKRLEQVKPFNDIWYSNCLMQTILTIIYSYGINILDFLKDDDILYFADDSINSLEISLKSQKFLHLYLSNHGIKYKEISWTENPIPYLIDSINSCIPTICSIDCFYESLRIDAYKLKHLAHTILVYGYETNKQQFIILEHNYANSMRYEERRIPFDQLVECMEGYAKYKPDDSMIQLEKFQNFQTAKIPYENQSDTVNKFWKTMEHAISTLELKNCEILIQLLCSYVSARKIMLYKMGKIDFTQNKELKCAQILMALIAKYKHTGFLKKETRQYCSELIKEIIFFELKNVCRFNKRI